MLQVLENRKYLECENGDSLNASPKTVRRKQKLVRQTQKQFARATRANLWERSDKLHAKLLLQLVPRANCRYIERKRRCGANYSVYGKISVTLRAMYNTCHLSGA